MSSFTVIADLSPFILLFSIFVFLFVNQSWCHSHTRNYWRWYLGKKKERIDRVGSLLITYLPIYWITWLFKHAYPDMSFIYLKKMEENEWLKDDLLQTHTLLLAQIKVDVFSSLKRIYSSSRSEPRFEHLFSEVGYVENFLLSRNKLYHAH